MIFSDSKIYMEPRIVCYLRALVLTNKATTASDRNWSSIVSAGDGEKGLVGSRMLAQAQKKERGCVESVDG